MINVELKDEDVQRALQQAARALTDMTPLMQELGEMLVESTKARFPKGVGPDGETWAPKSQVTIDAYRRREAKGQNTHLDFRPLFGPSGMLFSQIHYEATADSIEIGSNMIYAAVMQFGAAKGAFGKDSRGHSIPWGNIPARPFLGISATDRGNIVAAVEEWLGRLANIDGPH